MDLIALEVSNKIVNYAVHMPLLFLAIYFIYAGNIVQKSLLRSMENLFQNSLQFWPLLNMLTETSHLNMAKTLTGHFNQT